MFVNYSNHPSNRWEEKQWREGQKFGKIVDVPFAQVPPEYDEGQIEKLADEELEKILAYNPKAVMCQGEFSLVYQLVNRLKSKGIKVFCACSERIASETQIEDGTIDKISTFRFVRFREY